MTSLDNPIKGASLDWEQVQERGARSKTAWESIPAGCQWRDGLIKARAEGLKVTCKKALPRMLRGEEPTSSYSDPYTLLMRVANEANEQPAILWTPADYFVPLKVNQKPLGRMPGAVVEYCNDLQE